MRGEKSITMGRKKDAKKQVEDEIHKIIAQLKTYDETKDIDHEAEASMMEKLISIGKPAVPSLIELLEMPWKILNSGNMRIELSRNSVPCVFRM